VILSSRRIVECGERERLCRGSGDGKACDGSQKKSAHGDVPFASPAGSGWRAQGDTGAADARLWRWSQPGQKNPLAHRLL
jgi:hypothetical protein